MYGRLVELLTEKGRGVYTIRKGASVCEAVREMNRRHVGALLVMDGERPAGIFTERDVLTRVVDIDRDPALTRVVEVMTPDPVVAEMTMRVEEAMALMTNERFRHLPVTEEGRVVAMVSIGDLMKWVTTHLEDHIQLMSDYITGRVG